jgi:hypothetical protein
MMPLLNFKRNLSLPLVLEKASFVANNCPRPHANLHTKVNTKGFKYKQNNLNSFSCVFCSMFAIRIFIASLLVICRFSVLNDKYCSFSKRPLISFREYQKGIK